MYTYNNINNISIENRNPSMSCLASYFTAFTYVSIQKIQHHSVLSLEYCAFLRTFSN